jgi:restriction system protein
MNDILQMIEAIYIPEIKPDRKYWMVRTEGGLFFQDFSLHDYIALGWDAASDIDLIKSNAFEKLRELITKNYPDEKRPGACAKQILRFTNDMKKGDIVLIPGNSSETINIGELLEDEIYLKTDFTKQDHEIPTCLYAKRRKVKWYKTIQKLNIDPYLYRLLSSHYAITNADEYSHFIDRSLSSLYIKNNIAHLIVEVTNAETVKAVDIMNFIYNNLSCIDLYNDLTEDALSKNDVDMKINVQSPGPIEFFGPLTIISIIAFVGVVLAGGKAQFKSEKRNVEVTTEGLVKKISDFLTQKNKDQRALLKLQAELKTANEKLKIISPAIQIDDEKIDK